LEHPAVKILNSYGLMAISTVRPDGWPQTTVVGYANRGFELVFMIFRTGQKFANIAKDNRISIAVAPEPDNIRELKAVYAGAHASEITDEAERQAAWKLLMERHSNLAGFNMPDAGEAAFMRARCEHVSMLDYSQGPGHREDFIVGREGEAVDVDVTTDKWGAGS